MSTDTLQGFQLRINAVAKLYEDAPVEAVRRTTNAIVSSVREEIRSVAPGGVLRGVTGPRGGKGAGRITVSATFQEGGRRSTAVVSVKGPIGLIERDTKPHIIGAPGSGRTKAGSRARKRARAGLASGERPFLGNAGRGFAARGPVRHPGTKGKHPFERGVARALATQRPGQTAHVVVDAGLSRIFGS